MKAYLIHLSGQGDNEIYLLNQADFDYLTNGTNPSEDLVARVAANHELTKLAARELLLSFSGSSIDNDRALHIGASDFNGERYYAASFKPTEISAFVEKHKLELDPETWEGAIY